MRKLLAIMLLGLCSCDTSNEGGARPINGTNWTKMPCPSYTVDSGLYKIVDPENGNLIYLHIGSKESSLFVIPKQAAPAR